MSLVLFCHNIVTTIFTCYIGLTELRAEFPIRRATDARRLESEIKAVMLTLQELQLDLCDAVIRNQETQTGMRREERGAEPVLNYQKQIFALNDLRRSRARVSSTGGC